MKSCPSCTLDFTDDKRFCQQCGSLLVVRLPDNRQERPVHVSQEPMPNANAGSLARERQSLVGRKARLDRLLTNLEGRRAQMSDALFQTTWGSYSNQAAAVTERLQALDTRIAELRASAEAALPILAERRNQLHRELESLKAAYRGEALTKADYKRAKNQIEKDLTAAWKRFRDQEAVLAHLSPAKTLETLGRRPKVLNWVVVGSVALLMLMGVAGARLFVAETYMGWEVPLIARIRLFGLSQTELERKVGALLGAGDYEGALKISSEAVRKTPRRPHAWALKTVVLARSGKTAEAIEAYQRYRDLARRHSPELLTKIAHGALNDRDNVVRLFSADALGWLGNPETTAHLRRALKQGSPAVRGTAARALGLLDAKEAVPDLLEALKDPGADIPASGALAILREKVAVPRLLEVLEKGDILLREMAAYALGTIGDPTAVPGLRAALRSTPSGWHQVAASFALWRLGERGEGIFDPKTALRSDDPSVRSAAVTACGLLGVTEAVPDLRQLLKDEDNTIRRDAARALGLLGDRTVLVDLRSALNDPAHDVADAAAEALFRLGDKDALPALRVALRADEPKRVLALGLLGGREVISELEEYLGHEDIIVRITAVAALWALTR